MNVFSFRTDEIKTLTSILASGAVNSLLIAYDPIDNAIKMKVNNSSWSPPFGEAVPE